MFHRLIKTSKNNSFFMFGARGTGKSTWIQAHFMGEKSLYIDLLDSETEDTYLREPKALERKILSQNTKPDWVIIDEIQKAPRLLDLVHKLIESHKIKFILTGSSARKIKRGGANLLAGRAFVYNLFPLTSIELDSHFDLTKALHWGSMPKVWLEDSQDDLKAYLRSYALTYIKEEIQAEQIVRKLQPFREFLEIAALSNGFIINHTKIAKQVGCDTKTIQSYFQILEETWLGFYLQSYHTSVRKSLQTHPKFYFFDTGVVRSLARALDDNLTPGTSGYGHAFEHWVILEFYRLNQYLQKDYRLSYFMTHQGAEVDLVLSKPGKPPILIEIKSTTRIDEIEVNKLLRLAKVLKATKVFYLSLDPNRQKIGSCLCLPWQDGLKEIYHLGL